MNNIMDLSDSDSADPMSPYSRSDNPFTNNSTTTGFPIECRIAPKWWFFVIMCFVGSAFLLTLVFKLPAKPADRPVVILTSAMGLFFACAAVWMAFELMLSVIRADETGLIWRRPIGGWRSARWEEINDYYRSTPANKSGIVETPVGRVELGYQFAGTERIAELIIEKTPHLNNVGWEMKGTRSNEDWSRTFKPWSGEQMTSTPFMMTVTYSGLIYIAKMMVDMNNRSPIFTGLWRNTSALTMVLVVGGLIFGQLAWRTWKLSREWLFALKHRDEKLVLDARRLVFTSPQHNYSVKWQEIKRITLLPKVSGMAPVQIETASESFIIWHIMEGQMWPKIRLILEQYASRALKNGEARR